MKHNDFMRNSGVNPAFKALPVTRDVRKLQNSNEFNHHLYNARNIRDLLRALEVHILNILEAECIQIVFRHGKSCIVILCNEKGVELADPISSTVNDNENSGPENSGIISRSEAEKLRDIHPLMLENENNQFVLLGNVYVIL